MEVIEMKHGSEVTTVSKAPVSASEALRVLIALAVAAGWLTVQQANVVTVGISALGVLVSVGLTWWTARKTTPLAKPRTNDGIPLVPAPEKTLRTE